MHASLNTNETNPEGYVAEWGNFECDDTNSSLICVCKSTAIDTTSEANDTTTIVIATITDDTSTIVPTTVSRMSTDSTTISHTIAYTTTIESTATDSTTIEPSTCPPPVSPPCPPLWIYNQKFNKCYRVVNNFCYDSRVQCEINLVLELKSYYFYFSYSLIFPE